MPRGPVEHPSTDAPNTGRAAPPPGRYGERSPRRAMVVGLVALGAALLGWLVWAAVNAATPDTRSRLISFRVLDDRRVQVRLTVVADNSAAVTCTLLAQDATGEAVGVTSVTVPAGPDDDRDVEAVVPTRSRAVNATVAGCRLGTDD
jgi:hypothetical protein